jgi:hypothetical protein
MIWQAPDPAARCDGDGDGKDKGKQRDCRVQFPSARERSPSPCGGGGGGGSGGRPLEHAPPPAGLGYVVKLMDFGLSGSVGTGAGAGGASGGGACEEQSLTAFYGSPQVRDPLTPSS